MSMRNLRHNLLHYILLLALAVTPFYGLTAQSMPMQHNHATVLNADSTVDMNMMDCCDGNDGKCHGSSSCKNCTSCQHFNLATIQSIFNNIIGIVHVTDFAVLGSTHGIAPPVEIRPPQV